MLCGVDVLHPGRLDSRPFQHAAGPAELMRQGEGDHAARGARTGGATGAVDVLLDLVRGVHVHHHAHVVDVDAAGGHIGRDQHRIGALAEPGQHVGAQPLLLAAVQRGGLDPHLDELLRHALGTELGAREHQGAALARGQLRGDLALGGGLDGQHVVVHGCDRGADGGGLVTDGVHQEGVDDLLDLPVQGGGEQHLLGAHGDRGEDVADVRQEAEVGHVVGLVDHGGLHQVQLQRAALGEVDQAARRGHHDPDAAGDGVGLLLDVHATGDQLRLDPDSAGEGMDRVDHLDRELAGGDQHHAERPTAVHLAAAEAGGHREGEGEGLARAGLGTGEHVASREGVGQDHRLDLESVLEALISEDAEQLIGQRHVLEPLGAGRRAATGLGHGDPPDETYAPIIQHAPVMGEWRRCCAL